jgi:hypothetical protein
VSCLKLDLNPHPFQDERVRHPTNPRPGSRNEIRATATQEHRQECLCHLRRESRDFFWLVRSEEKGCKSVAPRGGGRFRFRLCGRAHLSRERSVASLDACVALRWSAACATTRGTDGVDSKEGQ